MIASKGFNLLRKNRRKGARKLSKEEVVDRLKTLTFIDALLEGYVPSFCHRESRKQRIKRIKDKFDV